MRGGAPRLCVTLRNDEKKEKHTASLFITYSKGNKEINKVKKVKKQIFCF